MQSVVEYIKGALSQSKVALAMYPDIILNPILTIWNYVSMYLIAVFITWPAPECKVNRAESCLVHLCIPSNTNSNWHKRNHSVDTEWMDEQWTLPRNSGGLWDKKMTGVPPNLNLTLRVKSVGVEGHFRKQQLWEKNIQKHGEKEGRRDGEDRERGCVEKECWVTAQVGRKTRKVSWDWFIIF